MAKQAESVRATIFNCWLVPDCIDFDPWIGVFENQDVSHHDLGRRIAFAFEAVQWDDAIVGASRGPDHKNIGPGWRYVLVAKVRTVGEAMKAMAEH